MRINVQENKNSEAEEELENTTRKYIMFKKEEEEELEREEISHSDTEYHILTFEHRLSDQSELRV